MNELRDKAKELLSSGDIELFIGYEEGTRIPRPLFASTAEEADKLYLMISAREIWLFILPEKILSKGGK